MRYALVVIGAGLIVFDPSLAVVVRADESLNVEAPLNRDGPRLTLEVVQRPAFSN